MRTPFLFVALCAAACASSTPPQRFIPTGVALAGAGDKVSFRAATLDATRLSGACVEKTQMLVKLGDHKRAESLPRELQSNLQSFLGMKSAPAGAGVLVVRSAITGARPDDPLADLGANQPQRGDGGYTSVEIYATEGLDGPVVAALRETIRSEKLTLDGDAAWARTEKALAEAAARFAKLVRPDLKFPGDR
jgi:hypothetical protein